MKTILVVDDEKNIRTLYEQELTEEGYNIILASNSDEAVEKYREGNIDLVVLDIKMEGKNGIDCLKEMMQENKNVKIIINTAYSSYKQDFASWLADKYLVKSSDISELKKTIRNLLASA
jgi:DNA-binding NtrC family response regulator